MRKLAFTLVALAAPLILASGISGAQAAPGASRSTTDERPTVLPTIIGHRHRGGEQTAARRSIPYPTTITAAGPVVTTWAGAPGPIIIQAPDALSGAPLSVGVPGAVGYGWYGGGWYGGGLPVGWYGRGLRYGDGIQDSHGAPLLEHGWVEHRDGPVLAPPPGLAPNPHIAPAPHLPPGPHGSIGHGSIGH